MTGCVLHGAAQAADTGLCATGMAIYDYQTLITGVLAIDAVYYAARPVWRVKGYDKHPAMVPPAQFWRGQS